MHIGDILIIVFAAAAVIGVALFLLNRWASKKQVQQQGMIEQHKMSVDIFVIDKKKDKAANVNLPKVVMDQLPRVYRLMKHNFIKAQVKAQGGAQITTLMCDKPIFEFIQVKKNYKVEIAGLSIVSVRGMKSKHEMKQTRIDKKRRAALEGQTEKEMLKASKKKK
jgi:hypothetical protein